MEIIIEEYRKRTATIKTTMADEELDLLLVYARGSRNMYSNVLYLTGYYCFDPCEEAIFFLPFEGEPELVLNVDYYRILQPIPILIGQDRYCGPYVHTQ
jgi:hypothetical protein